MVSYPATFTLYSNQSRNPPALKFSSNSSTLPIFGNLDHGLNMKALELGDGWRKEQNNNEENESES